MHHRSVPRRDDLYAHQERGFSLNVASCLETALALLNQDMPDEHTLDRVIALITPMLARALPNRQRMFACYMLGRAYFEVGNVITAAAVLEDAIELAEQLHEWRFRAEFLYVAAAAKARRSYKYVEAREYYGLALDSLEAFAQPEDVVDPALTCDALLGHAYSDLMCEESASALHYLLEARPIVALLPDGGLTGGTLEWYLAILFRWQGRPDVALYHASLAQEVFRRARAASASASRNLGRLNTLTADIVLDLIDSKAAPGDTYIEAQIIQALALARDGVHLNRASSSPFGESTALLALARSERAANLDTPRIDIVESVLRFAHLHDDPVVAAQCFTELGRELSARGENGAALECHRQAVDELGKCDASSIAAWSRRALICAAMGQDR